MAFQAGMGVSRIILIDGAGYGTVLFKNVKLSDVLADIQGLKEFADPSFPNGGITDCISQDLVEKPSIMPRMLTRTASSKC